MTKARDLSKLLSGGGSGGTIAPALVSDQDNTSTGHFDVPAGTTAQRPASPNVGHIRFNTTIDQLEQYTSDGWQGISAPPIVLSISPTSIAETDSAVTITVTGTAFSSSATVQAVGQNGSIITATSTSRNSSAELVATFDGTQFSDAQEDYAIKVTNSSGLAATLDSALSVNAKPAWVTAQGTTIATVVEDVGETKVIYGNSSNSAYTITASSEFSSSDSKDRFLGYEFGVTIGWGPALGTNHWWKIDLGAGTDYVLHHWSHYQHDGQGNRTFMGIQGSNDDVNWTTITDHTSSGITPTSTNYREIDFTPGIPTNFNTVYRYLRYKIEYSQGNYGRQNGLTIVVRNQTVGSVSATDPEGGSVTYTAVSGMPAGMTLSSDGTITGVPTGNTWANGDTTHTFTATASDGVNTSAQRTFNIIRKEINEEANPVTSTNPLIDLKFNGGSYTNSGSNSLTAYGSQSYSAGGPFGNGYYLNGGSFNSDYFVASIGSGGLIDSGSYTFMGWYKGTQSSSSSGSWSVSNPIFGDPRGSVYIGVGVDEGKIAVAFNGMTRGGACNDGNWHHLAFVHYSNNYVYAYLDGQYQFNVNTNGYASSKRLDHIMAGYAYTGTAAPTAVDGIKIYGDTLSGNQIRAMVVTGYPSTE
jgi:hypothetical protein